MVSVVDPWPKGEPVVYQYVYRSVLNGQDVKTFPMWRPGHDRLAEE